MIEEQPVACSSEPCGYPLANYPQRAFNYDIHITPLNSGFMLGVGCQSIAVESKSKLLQLLTDYINNPIVTEEQYRAGQLI